MRVRDVMTERVYRARLDTKITEVAQVLSEKQISALPIVDPHEQLVGIVTEHDLLRRREIGSERPAGDKPISLLERKRQASEYVKSHGLTAAEVMTWKVVTVTEEATLTEVVEIMEKHRIKRVPVLRAGKLIGIVSRLDLVRALLYAGQSESRPSVEDGEIKVNLTNEIGRRGWQLGPSSKIAVFEGVVHLFGSVTSVEERKALVLAAKVVPGVRDVQDHLEIREPRAEYI